ncbi:MAG: TolC family outer membrane protein [Alphaproteobacteria bacterium]|nr:TolC family outer membrane protein [Alphaproteobacteria bacterium]
MLSAVVVLAPLTATAETLTDAFISAYRNSNLLERNRAVLRAADEDVATAVATLRPTLDFVTSFNYTDPAPGFGATGDDFSATFSLVAQLVILDGGQRNLQVDLAKETVLATREGLRNVEQSVLLRAADAFFRVRSAQAFVDLRENNLRLLREELQAARDRFEVGEVTRTDVALAESRLAAARSQLAASRGELETAREAFRTAVGRYPGALQLPARLPATAENLDGAVSVAVRRHPEIRQAQREVTAADIGARIAERAYGPDLSATARLSSTDGADETASVGLELRQPIYRGGRLAALERQAVAQRDQARANLHQTTLEVSERVRVAWSNVQVARAQIRATDQQIRAAEIAFEGTREEARLGARTTLDVLDAEQDLLDARATRIDAVSQQYFAIYSLLSSMGLLTADHLNLGIPTYDPVAYYNAVESAPARSSPQGERLDRVLRRIGRE